jgi:cytosine/adenosine deaminase-related metal-dependent hydrolase
MELIKADWVIHDSTQPPQPGWAVVVEGGQIVAVGAAAELQAAYPTATVNDGAGTVLAPGFVNAHTHMYGVLAHGIPPAAAVTDFWSFLVDYWWPQVEDALDHAMIRAATANACMEMLGSGTTTFFDILEAPHTLPGALAVQAEVARQWGMRGILTFEATQRVSPENGALGLRENADFIDACRAAGGLLSGAMCYHTTFTCDEAFIRAAYRIGAEKDVRVHFHCSEGRYEPAYCLKHYGRRTVEHYAALGLLSNRTLASQCVQISAAEVDLLAQHGASVVSMPLSNCEVGGGFAPLPEMDRAGITLGLGTDGYVNNYFALMRGAYLMHKARLEDPQTMPADRVWQMATEGGARAIGLNRVGRLAPGWAADLILIDADLPTPLSAHNLREQLILWRDPQHIRGVMVGGQWRVIAGAYQGIDTTQVRANARAQAARLWHGAHHRDRAR